MARKHAMLSPSASGRWLKCTASALLEEQMPDTTSEYAEEGTLAHTLTERLLSAWIENPGKRAMNKAVSDARKSGEFPEEMIEHAVAYRDWVIEQTKELTDPILYLEQRIDLNAYVPESFGRCDCIIVGIDTLHVIDYKYGVGVLVPADENTQLRLYGLGALEEFDPICPLSKVIMSIYQPRRGVIDTVEMTADELREWGESIRDAAQAAYTGEGAVYAPGEDTCRFCAAGEVCRARAEYNLELAKFQFAEPETLSPEDIAEILERIDALIKWGEGVKKYALEQALNHGVTYPGWKLVEGRSNRYIADAQSVMKTLQDEGFSSEDFLKPIELQGLGVLEKLVGVKRFSELCGVYIVKPAGKPTLVPVSDKRPELNSAVTDFE